MTGKMLRVGMLLLLPAVVAVGCTDEVEILRRQVEHIRADLAQMRASSANSVVMLEDLQNKVLLLEDQMDSTRLALGRAPARSGAVGTTGLPVVRLAPAVEEQSEEGEYEEPEWNGSTPQVVFHQIDDNGRVQQVTGTDSSKERGARGRERPQAPQSQHQERPSVDSRPIEMYKSAYDALQHKRHGEAIDGFQRLVESYPSHDYADNALYWMGEAFYDQQDYKKAIECFDKLLSLYPDGNKVPDALLKTALSYQNLGDAATAKSWSERLLATYPQTAAAAVAREKIRSDW